MEVCRGAQWSTCVSDDRIRDSSGSDSTRRATPDVRGAFGDRRSVVSGPWRGEEWDRCATRIAVEGPPGSWVYINPLSPPRQASRLLSPDSFRIAQREISPISSYALLRTSNACQWPPSVWTPSITTSLLPLLYGLFRGVLQASLLRGGRQGGSAVLPRPATRPMSLWLSHRLSARARGSKSAAGRSASI